MSCLGPYEETDRNAVVNAYDQGRTGGAPRDAGTLPWRDGSLRDALLLAPEPHAGDVRGDADWFDAYADWHRDVRGPALAGSPAPPDQRRAARLLLPLMAAILGAPDPRHYPDDPMGTTALRNDLRTWSDTALLVVQEAGR